MLTNIEHIAECFGLGLLIFAVGVAILVGLSYGIDKFVKLFNYFIKNYMPRARRVVIIIKNTVLVTLAIAFISFAFYFVGCSILHPESLK